MNFKRVTLAVLVVLMAVTASAGTGFAQSDVKAAELAVDQPRHVGEPVSERVENGSRIYVVRGKYLEIEPRNFNQSDVTAFSVQESEALLSYDSADSEYVLNTQGHNGTFHLSWTVSEGGQTNTYRAAIRVVTAEFAHVSGDEFSKLQEDAARGSEVLDRLEGAGDEDEPVEQKVDFAVQVIEFAHNPFSALTGQFVAIQIMRFSTPAGWLDLTLIIGVVYALTRGMFATLARLRKQLEQDEQISRREDRQYLELYKKTLSGRSFADVDAIDDHQAAVLEERLGTNLFTALRNFWSVWGANSLKAMYADAMGAVGYRVTVTRDATGEITDLNVLKPDDPEIHTDGGSGRADPGVGDDELETETIALSSASDSILDALTWEQIDDRVFEDHPEISAVDHLMVRNRESDDDLIAAMNVSVPEDFESRQAFMEAIAEFLQEIQRTDFTDDEGRPRADRAVLNNVMAFATVMDQEHQIPLDLWWKACLWNADGLSRDDEATSVLSDLTGGDELVNDLTGGVHGD